MCSPARSCGSWISPFPQASAPHHRPIERLDSHLVPHQMDTPGTRIPNCHRKDAAQTRDRIETPTRVGLENNFSIRTGRKALAAGLQLATQLLKIIDLAVVGDYAPRGRMDHGLRPALTEIDDGKPAMRKHHLATRPEARPVRTSRSWGMVHPRNPPTDTVA